MGGVGRTGAWAVDRGVRWTERPVPGMGPYAVELAVEVCGVCRTDLHLVEGDLPTHLPQCTPGHEIVGRVVGTGAAVVGLAPGDRVGVAWLARTCGVCRYCRSGRENLCPHSRYTGWDLHGGYADLVVADSRYVYRLPAGISDEECAPLLCAGIIGYRALVRAELPPGGRLGIYGFGASAHLTAQLALARGATLHVFTRSKAAQRLALELGAASVQGACADSPEPLDAAILFAPVGELVPVALGALDRGGTLAVAGIHLTDVPALDYQRALFQERTLRSVTANTRADGRAYLAEVAARPPVVSLQRYAMAQAAEALADLAADRVTGAAVLVNGEGPTAKG
ncbi:zinc-binding alcohol dehydrogenase family protein [Kitasatospora sp. GP82]|uniref:zinc-binding alcohol dehydrogenase family protein n=1 Tax=Kitasatospora sp. GP82 TaxID=3035089 RepID=UPI002474ECDC|nr:zinc-binding alcohol dehydrogenase family protein [Kitasatospora sp. GP82]MDH6125371.1 propanol-preferring alcohol dehydrogenase [Kitasatospora sp. GP82]